ncbi:MAG: hypothetical protein JEZ01_14885 [Labilibaculum sp.]|nr:DUF6174 domain-containing protein [Labilibaculum sp.]MBI9059048.1 hypothetical protein [Labilibaculum sp.]
MKAKFLLFCFFCVSIVFVSCDKENNTVDFDKEEFQANRDQWNSLNLQDYSYEYSNSGYSFSGIASHSKIEIVDGEVEKIEALVENGIQDADNYLINDLFEEIAAKYPTIGRKDNSSEVYLEDIRVKYDETYHFPTEVYYIYHIPEDMVGIWNLRQYISNFETSN